MDVGVIGVGMMGRNHARVYAELRAVDRLLGQDLNRKAAEEMGRMHGATVCGTVEELLQEADARGADAFLSAEMKHHVALAAPLPCIEATHYTLEAPGMRRLAREQGWEFIEDPPEVNTLS